MKEALKLALEIALEKEYQLRKTGQSHMIEPVITAIQEALAQPEQEPVGTAMADYTFTVKADSGYQSTTEGRCTADQYGQAMAALHTTPPKPEPHNFCPRCGKRLIGMAFAAGGVHTCTPPEGGAPMNERDKELTDEAEAYADRDFKGEINWSEAYESKLIALIRADEREALEAKDWTAIMREGSLVTWGDAEELGERVRATIRARGNT